MDGDRLRAHSQYNTDGRLFIKFIALIIYTELSKIMKKKNLFKKYSVKELLKELKNSFIYNHFITEPLKKSNILKGAIKYAIIPF